MDPALQSGGEKIRKGLILIYEKSWMLLALTLAVFLTYTRGEVTSNAKQE
jgi:hypothetical protein